ncbi:tyrosine-type recombinase/integrase [Candidatus Neptunochlamydia vexilliferae]|uniref:Tyrosine recombinase XerC n=1 Tax=Candidatus Neptunichlamydia vexilliferae TaxID=1651774 RepID=A0ABS0B1V4_9BACT|nr:tyrosine-type recombinase/integrase [Candidatus Neptunochlamydia vexilliferae]MBF5060174.1 hypothetical protein [Candidatus Neptunochlamydia vexilliferae]
MEKDLLKDFEQQLKKQDLSARTISGYLNDIFFFKKWVTQIYGKEVPFSQIAKEDIKAFRQDLLTIKRQKATSINRRLQSLKRFFDWAHRHKHTKVNPCTSVRFVRLQRGNQPHSLNKKEVHALLRAAGQSKHGLAKRNYAFIQLALQTGMRIGEIVNLQFRDISIQQRVGFVRIVDGKGLRERKIPLNATARRALSAYLKGRSLQPDDFVFATKRGEPATVRGLQAIIQSLGKKAHIKRVHLTTHTLRHTFAMNFLQANEGKLVELASLLGHESLNTTAIYTRASEESLAESVKQIEVNIYD